MFFDIYKQLCIEHGRTPTGIAAELGIGKSTVSGWKKRGSIPHGEQLKKIAAYFNVPVGFLSGQNPFDYWKQINEDRAQFMYCFLPYWKRDVQDIQYLWGVNPEAPESASIAEFVRFIDATVEKLSLYNMNEWEIMPKPICQIGRTENPKKPLVNDDEELTEYLEQLKTRPEMRMLFSLTKGATKEDVERAVRIVEAALSK